MELYSAKKKSFQPEWDKTYNQSLNHSAIAATFSGLMEIKLAMEL